MKLKLIKGNREGFSLTVDGGIFGVFILKGAIQDKYEGIDGQPMVLSRFGESEPVLRNGEVFLPWHISAALTANGCWERSWVKGKEDSVIVEELLKIHEIYRFSEHWHDAVTYANKLANQQCIDTSPEHSSSVDAIAAK